MKFRYIIRCARMHREEAFISDSLIDLLEKIREYSIRYGEVDLLYLVDRA